MGSSAIIPALLVLSLTLGTLTQLENLAQTSADKAIKYSTDMNNAIDCAYTARPLTDCSPDLFSTSFKDEIDQSQNILSQIEAQQDIPQQAKNT